MTRNMRKPTFWHVRPPKVQIIEADSEGGGGGGGGFRCLVEPSFD